jgi:hypothetical protein
MWREGVPGVEKMFTGGGVVFFLQEGRSAAPQAGVFV